MLNHTPQKQSTTSARIATKKTRFFLSFPRQEKGTGGTLARSRSYLGRENKSKERE